MASVRYERTLRELRAVQREIDEAIIWIQRLTDIVDHGDEIHGRLPGICHMAARLHRPMPTTDDEARELVAQTVAGLLSDNEARERRREELARAIREMDENVARSVAVIETPEEFAAGYVRFRCVSEVTYERWG